MWVVGMCVYIVFIVWYFGYVWYRCNLGRIGVCDWGEFLEDVIVVDEFEESDSLGDESFVEE